MLPSQIKGKRILYTVLNWGLGHAARSIPLIRRLQNQHNEIYLASDGLALELIESELPELKCIQLPSLRIQYERESMLVNMLLQLPHLVRHHISDRRSIKTAVDSVRPDIIISDHRYGTFHKQCHNIFLGHQLAILNSQLSVHPIASVTNAKLINSFNEVWVPDYADRRLSGILSQNKSIRIPVHFINPLSRFKRVDHSKLEVVYDLLAVLSGPEPARTRFENNIIRCMNDQAINSAIVRGKNVSLSKSLPNIDLFGMQRTEELQVLFNKSKTVIARSGYSTIMDINCLGINSILVPTAGQTEQLYLSENIMQENIVFQKEVTLNVSPIIKE